MLYEDSGLCPSCQEPMGENNVCPACGYSLDGDGYDSAYLKPGATLKKGRYLVGGLSHKNGESATYDGFDYKTRETRWIREYFPTSLARRNADTGEVSPLEGLEAQYKALTSDFIDLCNEIKRLEVTERVIPITDVFVENNTVYAIYQSMDVVSFDEYLSGIGGKLSVKKALEMFLPFCNMVGGIHDNGYIHRGISPFTVYVDEDDNLYLWDFSLSATRTAHSELDAELFNGYSAPEQYAPTGWQGTWTDVYAVAALFYRTVSGFVPPKSTMIGEDRPLSQLEDLVMDMPKRISDAVSHAMAVDTGDRVQTVYDFVSRMIESPISNTAVFETKKTKRQVPETRPAVPGGQAYEREQAPPRRQSRGDGGFKYVIFTLVFTVAILVFGILYIMNTYFPGMLTPQEPPRPGSHSLDEAEGDSDDDLGLEIPAADTDASGEDDDADAEITVPRFVGQMLTVVEEDENYKALFEFTVEEDYSADFPEGVIFKQEPDGNTTIPKTENPTTVVLHVSLGPQLVKMPNLIGKSFDEATRILADMGLSYNRIDQFAAGAPVGSVVGSRPLPDEEFDPKEQVIEIYVMPQPLPDTNPPAE